MAHVLGSVRKLEPSEVNDDAINALRSVLEATPEEFSIECEVCGAERPLNVIDPGDLMFEDFECANVGARCKSPPTPSTKKRVLNLRPGSLVFAPRSPTMKQRWPGIIEDCPDGTGRYFLQGGTPNPVKAYFVTLISAEDSERKWHGGYFVAKEIRPLEQLRNLSPIKNEFTVNLNRALRRAYAAVPLSLKERLLKLSFVAHVAASRGIQLRKDWPSFPSMVVTKRRASSTAQLPGSAAGSLAGSDVQSDFTKQPKLLAEDPKKTDEHAEEEGRPHEPRKRRSVSPPRHGAGGSPKVLVRRLSLIPLEELTIDSD